MNGLVRAEMFDVTDQQAGDFLHALSAVRLVAHFRNQMRTHAGVHHVLFVTDALAEVGQQQVGFGDPGHLIIQEPAVQVVEKLRRQDQRQRGVTRQQTGTIYQSARRSD